MNDIKNLLNDHQKQKSIRVIYRPNLTPFYSFLKNWDGRILGFTHLKSYPNLSEIKFILGLQKTDIGGLERVR